MESLNPKQILDPTWICQAHKVDLEYYTYLLLGAQQAYLKNLENGRFDNFYEVAFHYFNLNTVIADSKMYGPDLKPVSHNQNLMTILSHLAQKEDSQGKAIVRKTSRILAETMLAYLEKQITGLEHVHFYFNNNWIHKKDLIYLVCKTEEPDKYEIIKLIMNHPDYLGCKIERIVTLRMPNLRENEFRSRLLELVSDLADFDPDKNVMVIGGGSMLDPSNRIHLAKDTVLLNRVMNQKHGFDANVLLDFHRLLEKQKSIPFKLKVN